MKGGRVGRWRTLGAVAAASLAAAVSVLATAVAAPGAAGAVSARPAMVRSAASLPALPPGTSTLHALSPDAAISADLVLAPRHAAGLAALATAVATPGSSQFRRFLSPAAFDARFAPAPADVDAARRWLAGAGLRVGQPSADGFLLPVRGSAARLGTALGIGFRVVRLPSGRVAHLPTAAPLVPAVLAHVVTGFSGLDDVSVAAPMLVHGTATPAAGSAPPPPAAIAPHASGAAQPHASGPVATPAASGCSAMKNHGVTADMLAGAYGFSSLYPGDEGQGVTVGVYELQAFVASDITQFEHCYTPVITAAVSTVPVDGGPGPGPTDEATLDTEVVTGMAPQANVQVFEGPNVGSGPLDTYAAMVNASPPPQVITTSWGQCEQEIPAASLSGEASLFQQAAVQGQTVIAASGDAGSVDCYLPPIDNTTSLAVDDPGSQPWVTSVGGTTLTALGPPPSQSVWNAGYVTQSSGGAGGGGISTLWTMPAWQTGPGVENGFTATTPCPNAADARAASCRQVPDVAFDADPASGYSVYCTCQGGWAPIGGTSMSSPLMAAVVALADEQHGSGLGTVNAALYQAGCVASPPFTDVTSGNNQVVVPNDPPGTPPGPYYPATAAYDLATGLGSPVASSLVPDLVHPVDACARVTSLGTTSGPPAGGTTVVVNGAHLTGVTEVDFGAGRPASIVSVTDSAVTVRAPASPTGGYARVPVIVRTANDVVGLTGATPFTYVSTAGYWMVGSDGGVYTFGQLGYFGSVPGAIGGAPAHPVVGMAATPDAGGYWLVGSDGGLYAFGDARFFGSVPGAIGHAPASPVVGMAATPDGGGYWLVGSDGGLYAFGDARFFGSVPGAIGGAPAHPVVGMAATPDGGGYWLVGSDGGLYAFGDARFFGSVPGAIGGAPAHPVVGMAATPDGGGYWLVGSDGGLYAFGDARFFGSVPGAIGGAPAHPVVGMAATPDAGGYWLVGSDGGLYAFGDAPFDGSVPGAIGHAPAAPVVGMATPS
jgi:hypothetical protein